MLSFKLCCIIKLIKDITSFHEGSINLSLTLNLTHANKIQQFIYYLFLRIQLFFKAIQIII